MVDEVQTAEGKVRGAPKCWPGSLLPDPGDISELWNLLEPFFFFDLGGSVILEYFNEV